MKVVFAFVFFTMAKGWYDVVEYFPPFMEWYLTRAKKQDYRYDSSEEFTKIVNRFDSTWLEELDKNIYEIYDFVKEHQDDEVEVFKYLIKNVKGLALAKAGFVVQLILGKYGCIDSVNTKVYKSLLDFELPGGLSFPKGNKEVKDALELTKGGKRDLGLYLKALHILGGDNHAQKLWDDWCEIIEKKLLNATPTGEPQGEVFITLPNGNIEVIKPYRISKKTEEPLIKNLASLDGSDGRTVSKQHRDLILPYGESKFNKFVDNIINE